MHYEARTIYKRGNDHILVMATSNSGIHLVYIDHRYQYAMLPELKVDDIGYVEFDRIHYIPWQKFGNRINSVLYKKMSDRQYNTVISMLVNMFTGVIVKHNSVFMYADEVPSKGHNEVDNPSTIFNSSVNENESIPKTEVPTDSVEEIPVDEVNEEPTPFVEDTVKVDKESVTIKEDSVDNNDNYHDQLTTDTTSIEDERIVKNNDGSVLYDLLYEEKSVTYDDSRSKYPAKKKSNKKRNAEVVSKRLFTKDEALSIAASATPVIMSRYNLNGTNAAKARRNARRLFNFEVNTHRKTMDYKHMSESGMSVEDIASIANIPLYKVRQYVTLASINKRATCDGNDKLSAYVNELISMKKYEELYNILNMSKYDLCEMYNASSTAVANVRINIYQVLALNPLYPVFGIDSYRADFVNELNSKRKCKSSSINIDIYNKIMELWDIYYRTINIHSKLLSGMMNPMDYVDEDNVDYFMSMIWNRFNRQRITDNRIFSSMQKQSIKNNDLHNFCMRFMVRPSAAYSSLSIIRKKMLSGKEDKK